MSLKKKLFLGSVLIAILVCALLSFVFYIILQKTLPLKENMHFDVLYVYLILATAAFLFILFNFFIQERLVFKPLMAFTQSFKAINDGDSALQHIVFPQSDEFLKLAFELKQMQTLLIDTKEALQTSERTKFEFFSIASHQLRAPLTSIRWLCELLLAKKAGELNDRQKDFIENLYTSDKRLISLIDNLSDVAHIESKTKFTIDKKLFSLNEVLTPVISEQSSLATSKHIQIDYDAQQYANIMLMADSGKIAQVFQNLLNNAIKFSPDNSKIEVGMKREGMSGIFYVRDFGLGIPLEQQSKIFQKFFRADNILEIDTAGIGLGLFIVKTVIQGHGGNIWFESEQNKGTTFYFQLPIQIKT